MSIHKSAGDGKAERLKRQIERPDQLKKLRIGVSRRACANFGPFSGQHKLDSRLKRQRELLSNKIVNLLPNQLWIDSGIRLHNHKKRRILFKKALPWIPRSKLSLVPQRV